MGRSLVRLRLLDAEQKNPSEDVELAQALKKPNCGNAAYGY